MAETHQKISPTKLLTASVVLAVVASVALRLVKNEDPERLFSIESTAGFVVLAIVTTVVATVCAYLGSRYVNHVIGMLLGGVGGGFTTAVFITTVPGMFWGLFVGAIVVTRHRLWRIGHKVFVYRHWPLACVVAILLGAGARYVSIDTAQHLPSCIAAADWLRVSGPNTIGIRWPQAAASSG